MQRNGAVSVDVPAHVAAWQAAGMVLGTQHVYQLVACEGGHL